MVGHLRYSVFVPCAGRVLSQPAITRHSVCTGTAIKGNNSSREHNPGVFFPTVPCSVRELGWADGNKPLLVPVPAPNANDFYYNVCMCNTAVNFYGPFNGC